MMQIARPIASEILVKLYPANFLLNLEIGDGRDSRTSGDHFSSFNNFWDTSEEMGVTVKSVYDKLKGIETRVSRALVRDTAMRMQAIIKQMGGIQEPLLAGYRTKIVDGNHLRRTDRRIDELRELNVAPLPGKSLVVFDPQYRLAIDVLPCEDGHAQERTLLPELLDTIEANDLWIADRNFCTVAFLLGIGACRGKFIIRQHGSMPFTLKGQQKRVGAVSSERPQETGVVYEQKMEVPDEEGEISVYRRITVHLYKPTRDGDTEIHVVTNLPKRVDATSIANLYRDRWPKFLRNTGKRHFRKSLKT